MGDWRDFPLPDGSYADDTKPFSQQDVVNYLPTFAEAQGTRSRAKYKTVPGLAYFTHVGDGPHRGARDVEGKAFIVSGRKLYQVAVDGTATEIGTIPGTGRVSMTHNQIAGGNQLIMATGDNSYVYDTVTETLAATGVALVCVDFLNQRILGVDQARRFWRYSGVATATSWEELDNESAESSPDRIVGGIVSQGEWLVFGERTIEVFSNSPTEATAFVRSQVIEKGCANANTICRLDNSVMWVGNDGVPYRLNGYTPVPIASKAIIDTISSGNPRKLSAFTWEDKGYVCYYVTAQDGYTFGYDVSSGKWHRRESYGFDRWRINTLFKWNNAWYAGDFQNGRMYRLQWGYVYEGCEIMPRKIRTGVLHNNGNRVTLHGFRLDVATGGPACSLPAPPTITGELPNGIVGDAVSYQYTLTESVPGQITGLVISGTFPPGLSLSATGLVTGTWTEPGAFAFTITPTYGCGDGVSLSETVSANDAYQLCGLNQSFAGGSSYPTTIEIQLGSDTGVVVLGFDTGAVPDRFVVEFDGMTVIDTGYWGAPALLASLNAAIATYGDPPVGAVQQYAPRGGGSYNMHASFTKSTATPTATVKVYGPINGTEWMFTLGCPGAGNPGYTP